MILSGQSKLAGVLGWPVGHSRSPRLHGYWLRQYGIDGAYVPLPVKPEDFETAVRGLVAAGFRGFNVTVPHKEAAFRLVDRPDDQAEAIGAVNTIIVAGDGTLDGRNTDGYGFMANLSAGAPDWKASSAPAVVLGAGGAARSVIAGLISQGAGSIVICNRTRSRSEDLAALFANAPADVSVRDWEDRGRALAGAGLLVNTTQLGMTGQPPLELDLTALPPAAVVTDIVYAPLETDLLRRVGERGHPVVDGLGMLLHQAVPGFEAWFGVRPEVTPALRNFVLRD